jgi:hypothetical protein
MNYIKIHDNIIQRAITRKLTGYCEKHHIILKNEKVINCFIIDSFPIFLL